MYSPPPGGGAQRQALPERERWCGGSCTSPAPCSGVPTVIGDRSLSRFVIHSSEIKSWFHRPPTVEEARPAVCPICGIPSHPPGGGLAIHGHGLRERQAWGPARPGGRSQPLVLKLRRYLCLGCGAVLITGPRGLWPGRLYTAQTIALALVLFGVLDQSPAEVRRQLSPWQVVGATAASGWGSLKRWAKEVQRGALFKGLRRCPDSWSLRQVAQRAGAGLAACSPNPNCGLGIAHHAWLGAAQLGMGITM